MRRLALAAVLLVAPLSLVACGGGSSSSGSSTVSAQITPVAYVKSAASNTAAQESVHVALKAAVAVSGEALSMSGAGAHQYFRSSGCHFVKRTSEPVSSMPPSFQRVIEWWRKFSSSRVG